ncbi:signal transduction histidine kinase [Chloropicon primus]|uniref:Signal transduction histidine kinase n=1 Tax=Chloropicon primus TaxID=1764295 RepID=A0A5B8MNG4_9CHLO|nr:signal transduction histidine kinase [Chloropicon primus]UPR00795.1 signal transduction histidine kinase [Chloropicon primus]|eukprot:QDZ21584.1 signal transduction histidine kinase [Chloropicon primus]
MSESSNKTDKSGSSSFMKEAGRVKKEESKADQKNKVAAQQQVSSLISNSSNKLTVLHKESLQIEETILVAQKRVHFQRAEAQRSVAESKEALLLLERQEGERKGLLELQDWEAKERLKRKELKEALLQTCDLLKEKIAEIKQLKDAENKAEQLRMALAQRRKQFQISARHIEDSEKRERLELQESHERAARNLTAWQGIDMRFKDKNDQDLLQRQNKLKAQQLKEFQQKEGEQLRELQHMKAKYRLAELDEDLSFTERFEIAKEERLFQLNKLDLQQKLEKQRLKKKIRVLKENARKANLVETRQLKERLLKDDQQEREKQLLHMQKKHAEQIRQSFEQELKMRAEDFADKLSREDMSSLTGSMGSHTGSHTGSKAGGSFDGGSTSSRGTNGSEHSDMSSDSGKLGMREDGADLDSAEMKAALDRQKKEAEEAIKIAKEEIRVLAERLESEKEKAITDHKAEDEKTIKEYEERKAASRHASEIETMNLIKLHNGEKAEMKNAHLRELENLNKSIQIEKQLHEQSLSESQVASEAKSEFLSFVCHELRNPLSGIVAIVDMLIDNKRLKGEVAESVRTIKQESELMCAIVNDVLDYAKIEANMLVLDPVEFNVCDVIEKAMLEQKEVARRSCPDVEMKFEIDPNVPQIIKADSNRMRQVLLNLVSNSIKFTFQGFIKVKVELDKDTFRKRLKFSVSDSGIGIPEKDLEHIFSAFSQSKPSITREFGGTGLGLSISKALIECMGGQIGVESTYGEGTMFWFTVLFSKAEKEKGSKPAKKDEGKEKSISSISGLSFLVAEDSTTLRKLWTRLLEEQGCTVDAAGNGAEALSLCEKNYYDVVLMDITMPVLSGDQAVKKLRKGGWDGIVVALTGNALEIDQEKFLAAGMDAVLTKPFQMERLRLLIMEEFKKKGKRV